MEQDLAAQYLHLFATVTWGTVQCRFALLENEPSVHIVSNISLAARTRSDE